jgi:hypothetical protein
MVKAWEEAVLSSTAEAIAQATRMQDITNQYNQVLESEYAARMHSHELDQARQTIQSWLAGQSQADPQAPLDALRRWQLLSAAARAIDLNPAEQALLETAPPPEAPASAYSEWVGQVLTSLDLSLATAKAQEADLVGQREALSRSWNEALSHSGGLSTHLTIEPLPGADEPARRVHTPAAAALIGGVIGVLVWVLFWLVRPLRKGQA